jgi:hypothetical protein
MEKVEEGEVNCRKSAYINPYEPQNGEFQLYMSRRKFACIVGFFRLSLLMLFAKCLFAEL